MTININAHEISTDNFDGNVVLSDTDEAGTVTVIE